MKKTNTNTDFIAYSDFRKLHEDKNGGFKDRELAAKAMDLKRNWWGSNLVCLGIAERDGIFYPQYNTFD